MATATNINGWNVGGNNNSFDQRGHFYRGVFSGNVSGMLVKQNSTPNMTVLVEHGSALLNKNTISTSIAEIKSDTSVTIDTANTANPRIDTVVIYEDTSVAIPTAENNYWQDGAGGRFKIVSLPGTAGASPVALSDANIQSAIGAGKPWTRLADITVPANSTTILNSNIADRRAQLGGAYMPADKIDFDTFPLVAPSLMIPTVVNVKEVPIGKVEVSEGVFRTLYFMRWQTTIYNVQVQAFDPPYPAGNPEQIVNCIVKQGDGIGGPVLPWGNEVGNWARYSDKSTKNRIIMVKDSAGSWSGALVQLLLWYYKAS